MPFDAEAYEDSLESAVLTLGSKQDFLGGKITVYSHQSGYWGACIAVKNNTPAAVTVLVDCSGSDNAVSPQMSCARAGVSRVHGVIPVPLAVCCYLRLGFRFQTPAR